jgi:IS605 OrfB family transposase
VEAVRTICVKLAPTPEQVIALNATLVAFADASNRVVEVCRTLSTTSKYTVQTNAYDDLRRETGLSSNLVIRAIARTCGALKVVENPRFAPTSVSYDQRIFSFRESDWTFSLTTTTGRVRVVGTLGTFQQTALAGQKPTSATLVKRGCVFYLHIQVKASIPKPEAPTDVLGVDLGIANVATDSDGKRYTGKAVEKIRRKHNLQRKRLQCRGTKGAKKKLQRVSGKEARFRRHENHVISKRIVETAKRTGRGIALEDLQGIRDRVTARGGDARNRLSGWAFYQLRTFIEYKAAWTGVGVVTVNPRNTSRTCAACGHCEKANRKSQDTFLCKACGHNAHADENAARNIRALGICNLPTELAGFVPSRKATPRKRQ